MVFLEVISEFFMNSAVFYLYFGMILMAIGLTQISFLQYQGHKVQIAVHLKEVALKQIEKQWFTKPLIHHVNFIKWFIKTFRRMNKMSTDIEDDGASNFLNRYKIRGGQSCSKTTYSHLSALKVLPF